MKRKLLYPAAAFLVLSVASYFGCDLASIPRSVPTDDGPRAAASPGEAPAGPSTIPDRTPQTLLIGSFNMQRLGPSKLSKPWVLEKFAHIIRSFDVLALQEITSQDQTTLDQLLRIVNSDGSQYAYTISPRIGRAATGYYEQYAFVYDSQRVVSGPQFAYVVQDQADLLHREPFVGRFQARTDLGQAFSFSLINIHTDPDEIDTELDVLAQVVASVRQFEYPEDDVLLLGDLNSAPGRLGQLDRLPNVVALIQAVPTNTRGSKTLDNVLIDRTTTTEFTGRSGVIDLASWFKISQEEALMISDHLPVWAEFAIVEQPTMTTAAAGSPAIRR
ncbi:MAG: endonuclease/exonuclease/phosphatase [Planctomycetota bacterium]|nr:MAG: endonuclease/exonuclease/phosphatase [Planctomycetota bacterium]